MSYEYEFLERCAEECVKSLDDDTIEYFKKHISYANHHFGYGMYLRNKFSDVVDADKYSNYDPDELSEEIYVHILAKIFPELGNNMKKIKDLTGSMIFSEIFACYYLKTERIVLRDFPISEFKYSEFKPLSKRKTFKECEKWFEEYEKNLNEYVFSIAEALWDYKSFREQAVKDGICGEKIDELYELCKKCLKDVKIFIPLEIAYYSKGKCLDKRIAEIAEKCMGFFFEEHSNAIELIPEYVFENREFVKNAVKYNGYGLRFAPSFKNDYEIVKLAVADSPGAIQFAGNAMKRNMDILKTAAANSKGYMLFSLSCMKKYKDNDKLIKAALRANGANIAYASKRIRDNYEMARFALLHQSDTVFPRVAFRSLSARLRDDKRLAMLELKREFPCVSYFSKRLRNDDEIAEFIYRRKSRRWLLYQMSPRVRRKYNMTVNEDFF